MLTQLTLRHTGPLRELSLSLAPRVNLFTGDNGLGKSFLLDILWWSLTNTWASTPALPHPDAPVASPKSVGGDQYLDALIRAEFEPARSHTYRFHRVLREWYSQTSGGERGADRLEESLHPGDGLVLYAKADGGFSVWDSVRNPGRYPLPEAEAERPRAFHFTREELWDGRDADAEPGARRKVLCNGLIEDWVLWQSRGNGAFQQLCRVLEGLSPDASEVLTPGTPVRISIQDSREFPTLRMPYGQDVPVTHASAGMRRIVGLAYMLVWAWREHVATSKLLHQPAAQQIFFLIDEVEAHLHPRWQRTIMPALLKVMAALTEAEVVPVQMFAASHSPLLLASLEPHFEPSQDALWKLDLRDGQIALERDRWRPRGDASAWLTSDVFDLPSARSVEAEVAIQHASALMGDHSATSAQLQEAHQRLLGLLRETDPFWVRWIYLMDRRGLAT